jgi:cytochrome b561
MLVGAATLASGAVTVDLADGRVPDASVLAALTGLGTSLLLIVLLRVQAVFVVSTSTLALRSNAFSRWLSYFGYGIALVMFFMPILSEPVGLAFPVWVGVLSIALVIRRRDVIPDRERT